MAEENRQRNSTIIVTTDINTTMLISVSYGVNKIINIYLHYHHIVLSLLSLMLLLYSLFESYTKNRVKSQCCL